MNTKIDPDRLYQTYGPESPKKDWSKIDQTFFFYDLETSGLSSREDRIMQFAGLRTDQSLNPLGDPVNILIKLNDDTLPSPGAIIVTKITPQSTQQDGLTEAEFAKYVQEEIFTPGTCAIGYNSVRFDDEFMRHLFWRTFYDPYEWQWKDGRSRWDLLDVVRLTRALRPEGINWPVTKEGKATNRLELLTKLNGISHEHAHDALSDVYALVAVTKLIKEKQPKLYEYLFNIRNKKEVQKLINLETPKPFVYASGRYSAEHEKTTVAFPIAPAKNGNVLVFDLRYNLDELLATRIPDDQNSQSASFFPVVKELCYNKCPAVAPLGVLEQQDAWQKIHLDKETVAKNLKSLSSHPDFIEKMRSAYESRPEYPPAIDSESALYDGFLDEPDRARCNRIHSANADQLADLHPEFTDERLAPLLLHYKAKNFPKSLTEDETAEWEKYRHARLSRQAATFTKQLSTLAKDPNTDQFILEELNLWYQSILPTDY